MRMIPDNCLGKTLEKEFSKNVDSEKSGTII